VATNQALVASSGAPFASLANITSALLNIHPSLQPYLESTFDLLSNTSAYAQSATGLSSTALYSTAGAIALLGAIPAALARSGTQKKSNEAGKGKTGNMSRFGWSTRGGLSPFSSNLGEGGVPAVTEDDFSYITSEDLESSGVEHRSRDDTQASEEPDVLQIRSKGKTYNEHFPAYSIGDGQVLVADLQERIQLLMKLSDKQAKRMRLLYKGRQLKDLDKPVRDYGVKNNSEVLVILGDVAADDSSDDGSEEIVVIDEPRKKSKKKKSKSKKNRGGERSPPDTGLELPSEADRRPGSSSRTQSPSVASGFSGASSGSAVQGGPVDKINNIGQQFTEKLLPLALQFTAKPPTDPKKREDEHRRISETVMQQVILKLDGVDTEGQDEARARRRELVRYVQGVLKDMDARLKG
jgi:hypothetical protein